MDFRTIVKHYQQRRNNLHWIVFVLDDSALPGIWRRNRKRYPGKSMLNIQSFAGVVCEKQNVNDVGKDWRKQCDLSSDTNTFGTNNKPNHPDVFTRFRLAKLGLLLKGRDASVEKGLDKDKIQGVDKIRVQLFLSPYKQFVPEGNFTNCHLEKEYTVLRFNRCCEHVLLHLTHWTMFIWSQSTA